MAKRRSHTQQHEDDEFERGDAGASLTYPVQCSALRKGGHVKIHDGICKIVDIHSSKVGKHGHAKVSITGLDIFTNKRFQTVHPASHNLEVPWITRTDYTLVDAGNYMSLMDDKGFLRADIPVPDGDLGQAIHDKLAENADETIMVTILCAMGQEMCVGMKTAK